MLAQQAPEPYRDLDAHMSAVLPDVMTMLTGAMPSAGPSSNAADAPDAEAVFQSLLAGIFGAAPDAAAVVTLSPVAAQAPATPQPSAAVMTLQTPALKEGLAAEEDLQVIEASVELALAAPAPPSLPTPAPLVLATAVEVDAPATPSAAQTTALATPPPGLATEASAPSKPIEPMRPVEVRDQTVESASSAPLEMTDGLERGPGPLAAVAPRAESAPIAPPRRPHTDAAQPLATQAPTASAPVARAPSSDTAPPLEAPPQASVSATVAAAPPVAVATQPQPAVAATILPPPARDAAVKPAAATPAKAPPKSSQAQAQTFPDRAAPTPASTAAAGQAVASAAAGETIVEASGGLLERAAAPAPEPLAALDAQPDAKPLAIAAAQAPLTEHEVARAEAGTVATLAAQIVRKAEGGRASRFDLQLTPEGLGRVDVSLEFGANGKITAALSFDSPQACADLRARSGDLTRMLEQAGFDVAGGLTFETAGDNRGGREQPGAHPQQQDANPHGRGRAFLAALEGADEADLIAQPQPAIRRAAAGGVDLRV